MKYNKLGRSDLHVSAVCLGTMTYGQQNTEAEAHAQLDYALDRGINFIDTAEMYPVPGRAETCHRTEEFIGSWLKRQPRDKVILATKAAGPARTLEWIRGGPHALDRANIREAIEGSLRRLRTDHVDLYQLHWPERNVPLFGGGHFNPARERECTSILAQLEALDELVREGKVRHVGLSNETPWGVCEFVRVAERHGLPRVASIQNACSLLNRTFEDGLSEACFRESVGLLAYSPLAMGHLSGKYLADPGASGRITLFEGFGQRYAKPGVRPAVSAYVELARKLGLAPAQMALAFVSGRWYVASTIIGATSMAQLKENIDGCSVELAPEAVKEIEAIHLRYPNPAP